ncbi:30S ribosome-binding factor RbfA [Candidatus Phytoplasma fraxini]|uniref:Ribosome-binding factor A n=1 Tax=Ash yellows phytoplasma TaxID=35780 RepID=A0ABZ2UDL9_ASHYP
MSNITIKRRANIIHKFLVQIVNEIIEDSQIGCINLTNVDLSNDLSFCNVYYTILNDKPEILNLVKKALQKHQKEIRLRLASKIKNIKKIPELIFKYDETLTYGKKIDELFNNIIKE